MRASDRESGPRGKMGSSPEHEIGAKGRAGKRGIVKWLREGWEAGGRLTPVACMRNRAHMLCAHSVKLR